MYIGQRELAAVAPHDKNVHIIGSDDATSCMIVVVRHTGEILQQQKNYAKLINELKN